ncbi:MAG: ribosome biogenesis GTPase Der [Cyclobacteriaceae bacterium]
MANIVAIVGRPNVGKSTFFNRMIGERKAIMDNQSGITRDRHYGQVEWTGKNFTLIDTGGYVENSEDIFQEAIKSQVMLAIDEATVILFMVDIEQGVTGLDKEFANILRKSKKPVILIANKADNTLRQNSVGEFYELGFDSLYGVSSQNGYGTGDLLDEVISHFEEEGTEDPYAGLPRVSIVGRPNVGKSSFLNAILNEERSIVTDIAGTTRDSLDTVYNMYDKEFVITDTAGIRKKAKVNENVEFYSVLRAINSLENTDVCILIIDATLGLEAQDLNILKIAQTNRKGIVILVNKWDLVEDKESNTAAEYEKEMRERLAPHHYIPIIFISVLEKQRIFKALEKALEVHEKRSTRVPTSKLNEALLPEIEKIPPAAIRGRYIKIKYITQLPTYKPTFAFFANHPKDIQESYERFLENKLRKYFDFEGVPIQLIFKQK